MDKISPADIFANLSYDKNEMKTHLAEAYFKQHNSTIRPWVNGTEALAADTYLFDNYKNKIFLSKTFTGNNYTEWQISNSSRSILLKLAATIQENTELFAQIDYLIRGIAPGDTKKVDIASLVAYFRYYANTHSLVSSNPTGWKSTKSYGYLFKNNSPLASLGWLASALIAGSSITILASKNVAALAVLFAQLCGKAGLPTGVVNVFIANEEKADQYQQAISSLLDSGVTFLKSHRCAKGTTVVVTETADLDSAIDTILSAQWSHREVLPWKIKNVLVQESVSESFRTKLLEKVNLSEAQYSIKKEKAQDIEVALKYIRLKGVEYLEVIDESNYELPIILLANVAPHWEWETDQTLPIVATQAYRTTKELLAMLSACPALALSLWSDSVSIGNEIIFGADVRAVWVNSFGITHPSLPMANSIGDVFGGKAGYVKHFEIQETQHSVTKLLKPVTKLEKPIKVNNLGTCVETALKLLSGWKSLNADKKSRVLERITEVVHKRQSYYVGEHVKAYNIDAQRAETIFSQIPSHMGASASYIDHNSNSKVNLIDNNLTYVVTNPLGVIYIDFLETPVEMEYLLSNFVHATISPLVYGNAVVFATNSSLVAELAKDFRDYDLPVVTYLYEKPDENAPKKFGGIDAIWQFMVKKEKQLTVATEEKTIWIDRCEDIHNIVASKDVTENRFTKTKAVWIPFGETFAN